jgi:hypothetical protein
MPLFLGLEDTAENKKSVVVDIAVDIAVDMGNAP